VTRGEAKAARDETAESTAASGAESARALRAVKQPEPVSTEQDLAPFAIGLRITWAMACALGLGLGAYVGLQFFPEAGILKNRVGDFKMPMLALTLALGVGLSVAQVAVLIWAGIKKPRTDWLTLGWGAVTTGCIVVLVLPLYWVDFSGFLGPNPLSVAFAMLWGAVFLGYGQMALLQKAWAAPKSWAWRTIVGVSLGAAVGFPVGGRRCCGRGPQDWEWAFFREERSPRPCTAGSGTRSERGVLRKLRGEYGDRPRVVNFVRQADPFISPSSNRSRYPCRADWGTSLRSRPPHSLQGRHWFCDSSSGDSVPYGAVR
jgi:hypothetical protein